MKKSFCLMFFFCFGTLCSVQAQSLAHLVPEETLVFVSLTDSKQIEPQALKTIWGQFCQLPSMQETIQDWKKESVPLFNTLDGLSKSNLGLTVSDVMNLLQGEVSFALIQGDTRPHGIFSCFYGTQKELILQLFSKFLGPASLQKMGNVSVSVYQQGGIFAYFGTDRLFVSDSQSELEKILLQLSAPSRAFSQSALYQKHHSGNDYCSLFVNIAQLLRLAPSDSIPVDLEVLGLHNIGALSLNYGYEGEYLQWKGRLSFNATPSGLFACAPEQELQESSIRHFRGPLSSATVASLSVKNWFLSIQNVIKELDPDSAEDEENGINRELWKEFGFTMEELFSIFGNTLTAWDFTRNGTSWSLMAVELASPEIFEKLILPRMARIFPIQFRTKQHRGVTIYQFYPKMTDSVRPEVQYLEGFLGGLSFWGMPTNFMVVQNQLILASLPQALQAYLDSESSFSGQGPLAQLNQHIKGKIFSILSYDPIPSASSYRNILHFLKRFETVIRTFGVPIAFENFPRAKDILPLIRPNSFEIYWKENVLNVDLKIGFPLTMDQTNFAFTSVAGVGIVAAIAIPGLLRARISANETSAIGTLRSLSTSQNQFQNACVKDRDLDGVGEYGFFTELAGTLPVPVGTEEGSPAKPLFINSVLGTTSVQNGGIAQKSGYYFVLYLPSGSPNGPIRENGQMVPPASQEMTETEIAEVNAQETRWCAYAWPIKAGNTGNKAFFINQAGEVMVTSNVALGASYLHYSGLYQVPQANDIFNPDGQLMDLDASILTGMPAPNSLIWNPSW